MGDTAGTRDGAPAPAGKRAGEVCGCWGARGQLCLPGLLHRDPAADTYSAAIFPLFFFGRSRLGAVTCAGEFWNRFWTRRAKGGAGEPKAQRSWKRVCLHAL